MKKILISGASSGIGKAISQQLLGENHQVIGLAAHPEKFQPANAQFSAYPIDFANLKHTEQQLKTLQKQHPSIDAIICAAGIGRFGCVEQFSIAQMQQLINVNFLSQVLLIKTFLSAMKKTERGNIILIGSEAALSGEKQGSIYCASKFALRGFSQSLRKECANTGLSVSLLNPGMVNTPFFDGLSFEPADRQQNAIQPEAIAGLVSEILAAKNPLCYEEVNLQPLQKKIRKKKN
jgi:3-hydroxy acid dehydrogenase/malonic semialdehyde reductase